MDEVREQSLEEADTLKTQTLFHTQAHTRTHPRPTLNSLYITSQNTGINLELGTNLELQPLRSAEACLWFPGCWQRLREMKK